MATRAAIGYLKGDGSVVGAYVHYDGYPDHTLTTLVIHYNSPVMATSVVEIGAIDILENDINKVVQIAPGRPILFTNREEFVKHFEKFYCEYFYLYSPTRGWFMV